MEFYDFLYKKRIKGIDIAEQLNCTTNTIVNLKLRKTNCTLLNALKINRISNGRVTFEELLCKETYYEYKKWLLKEFDE